MTEEQRNKIAQRLWPDGSRRDVWMIADSARDTRISAMLASSFLEHSCLYSGDLAPEVRSVAPYLIQLEYNDARTDRFIERGWGNSWGVFLKCDKRLDLLRRHLREFLMVRDPMGRSLLFRYYDPRVLRVYLPTCNFAELSAIFGPVERFWMESADSGILLEYGLEKGKLIDRRIGIS
jgi:hypothetical protein